MTESIELSFIEKIADVQAKLNVPKTKNAKVPYASRSAEKILEAATPLLAEHGLAITLDDKLIELGGRLFIESKATIIEGEGVGISGTGNAELLGGNNMMNAAQATGATTSYARKYALGAVLAIGEGEDADDEKYRPVPNESFHSGYLDDAAKQLTGKITEPQVSMIELKRNQLQASDPATYEEFGEWYKTEYENKPWKQLSKQQGSLIIGKLKKLNGEEA